MVEFALGVCVGIIAETLAIIIFAIAATHSENKLKRELEQEKKRAEKAEFDAERAKRDRLSENLRQIGGEVE